MRKPVGQPPEWKTNISNFNASLPTLSLEEIRTHYEAADTVAKSLKNLSEMRQAITACENIRAELVKRSLIHENDEFIKWEGMMDEQGKRKKPKKRPKTKPPKTVASKLEPVPWAPDRVVPRAEELCRPILVVLAKDTTTTGKLQNATARQVSFPSNLISKKYENEGGASFQASFNAAIRHLIMNKMVFKEDGKVSILESIRDTVLKVKIPPINSTMDVPQVPRIASGKPSKWKINFINFNASLPTLSIEEMKTQYDAADTVTKSPKNLSEMGDAIAVCENIRAELVNRGIIRENDEYIKWPTTDAPGGDGSLLLDGLPEMGPLRQLGYRVGRQAVPAEQRCRLLSRVFLEDLPEIVASDGWGGKNTGARLKKLADSIASFARNAKHRKSANMVDAIHHWENDLEYLRTKYYIGRFDWKWTFPSIYL